MVGCVCVWLGEEDVGRCDQIETVVEELVEIREGETGELCRHWRRD